MVQTVKFSQFANADLTNAGNVLVGVGGGLNIQSSKVVKWTTLTRPTPPFDGLLGYNTDIDQYEYYDQSTLMWMQLLTSQTGFDWSTITAMSINATSNSGYVTNRSVTPVNILLPATFNVGDIIEVMGLGLGGWVLVANTAQIIRFGAVATSTAGSINSDIQYANITVRGLVENTTWSVISVNSNPTYV